MPAFEHDMKLQQAVLNTLAYFDLFNYPLKCSEVVSFLEIKSSPAEVQSALEGMVADKQIHTSGELFSLQSDSSVFQRRREGNAFADELLPYVQRQADLIFRFPFVRAVMASGSFSKNYMDKNSDFDFFLVCAPKRIWISRMLLVLYKKIFLKNSHKYFCVNYFIDETTLDIGEKNIFTATELATVLPLNGFCHYQKLMAVNQPWLSASFPNYQQRNVATTPDPKPLVKSFLEVIFSLSFASQINRIFKWITIQNWKKQYGHHYSVSDFKIAFKSTDSVSKNHPRNFQKRILELYQKRLNALSQKVEAL